MSRIWAAQLIPALFLILLGALLLAGNLGWFVFRWDQVWAIFFIVLGVWLVWRGFLPREARHIPDFSWGFGEYEPDLAGKTIQREQFSHGFGELDLDLREAVFPDGENVVRASHGFGDLKIKLPRDLAVKIQARAGLGSVKMFEEKEDGIGPHAEFQSDDYATASRKLFVEASIGFGDVKIVR